MTETLFRDHDIHVRRRAAHGSRCCVVTFDSFSDLGTIDRPGYGEAFLDRSGIDAIHVVGRDNAWYQYTGIPAAMTAIRSAAAGYDRVVTYGSSMGGYAAIRLAALAGAHAVFALSPQFSINPRLVFWERRWPDNAARFRDVWESALPWPSPAEAYIAYDPRTPDSRHVALIRARFPCRAMPLPYTGHPVTGFLAETGLLQQAILAICAGTFDWRSFTAAALAQREHAPLALVERANADWRLSRRRRIAMMRDALRRAPENAVVACRLGQQLTRAGLFDEALAHHRRAIALEPTQPYFAWAATFCLDAMGRPAEALATMQAIPPEAFTQPRYRQRLDHLRSRTASAPSPGRPAAAAASGPGRPPPPAPPPP
jgi:pimeloyl-ACP methyl ester carboxylesterase